jgi:N-acetyl-anhydromuramyl-L-alanine amidase AmpD|tara:strand:- start:654 stop:1259 length:606 start_codon:yes stop_codon:yes gene_type:complete
MLEIRDVETISKKNLNHSKRSYKKKQILLYDTKRRIDDFINKLKHRQNSQYEDLPHFIISKMGDVYRLLDTKYHSKTFGDKEIDCRQIKIAVENLGWLNKNTITGYYSNWIGDPFRSEPFVRSWRDKFYWDRYSEPQMECLIELCLDLCNTHNIKERIVPSNGFIEKIDKFEGIVCKSNFSNIYTDINPSFNFKKFTEQEI